MYYLSREIKALINCTVTVQLVCAFSPYFHMTLFRFEHKVYISLYIHLQVSIHYKFELSIKMYMYYMYMSHNMRKPFFWTLQPGLTQT